MNLAEQHPEEGRTRDADHRAHDGAQQELAGFPARAHEVKDGDAEQGADRVDEHTFPLQRGPDCPCRTDERQERKHDRRVLIDEDRADLEGHAVAHPGDEQAEGYRDAAQVTTTPTTTRRMTTRCAPSASSPNESRSPASNRMMPTARDTKGW